MKKTTKKSKDKIPWTLRLQVEAIWGQQFQHVDPVTLPQFVVHFVIPPHFFDDLDGKVIESASDQIKMYRNWFVREVMTMVQSMPVHSHM